MLLHPRKPNKKRMEMMMRMMKRKMRMKTMKMTNEERTHRDILLPMIKPVHIMSQRSVSMT